jgi:hypothetical protein
LAVARTIPRHKKPTKLERKSCPRSVEK